MVVGHKVVSLTHLVKLGHVVSAHDSEMRSSAKMTNKRSVLHKEKLRGESSHRENLASVLILTGRL